MTKNFEINSRRLKTNWKGIKRGAIKTTMATGRDIGLDFRKLLGKIQSNIYLKEILKDEV